MMIGKMNRNVRIPGFRKVSDIIKIQKIVTIVQETIGNECVICIPEVNMPPRETIFFTDIQL